VSTDISKYAVLFSAASEAVYGPELVSGELFDRAIDAASLGARIARIQGFEYEVMHSTPEGWRNNRGESPVQVVRRRWQ
jgi:hypothetical protein